MFTGLSKELYAYIYVDVVIYSTYTDILFNFFSNVYQVGNLSKAKTKMYKDRT